jgi:hypothetical protein
MTIISTADYVEQEIADAAGFDLFPTKPVSLEQALDIAEERAYASKTPAFPPVTDTIVWIKQVDWVDVRRRCRAGVNNCGLVIAVIGEKMHDLGVYLAEV